VHCYSTTRNRQEPPGSGGGLLFRISHGLDSQYKKSPDVQASGLFSVTQILLTNARYYLRNLIDNFDINDVAIYHGDLLVLAVIRWVVINGRVVSVIGRIVRINGIRIIVVD
jgi:hypothetical protein